MTKTIFFKLMPILPKGLQIKLALIDQSVSEKMFENNGHIHVYSPRVGADNPLESIVFFGVLFFPET